jgi:hypothetical protein
VSGDKSGSLTYTRDDNTGGISVTGEYGGETIACSGELNSCQAKAPGGVLSGAFILLGLTQFAKRHRK